VVTGGKKILPLGGVNGTGGVGYGARGTGIAVPAALSDDAAREGLADSGGFQAAEISCFALHETLEKKVQEMLVKECETGFSCIEFHKSWRECTQRVLH
jgi:hypothetical protein